MRRRDNWPLRPGDFEDLARFIVIQGRSANRLARVGARVVASGFAAIAAAARLREVRGPSAAPAASRARALVMRDLSRRILELHGVSVVASGLMPMGPAIIVANHVGWLDPLVVAGVVPCVPVSKSQVSEWPIVGGFARDIGTIFVKSGDPRGGARAARAAERALADGLAVLDFPEGATVSSEDVLPFGRGLFGLAHRLGVPVVPAALAYEPSLFARVNDGSFPLRCLRLAGEGRICVRLKVGTLISPGDHIGPKGLAAAARERILDLLGEKRDAAVGT